VPEGQKPVVWVVDDVESVRKSIAAVLETANLSARDYPSAAAFLQDYQPETRGCLVVDYNMPGMTGLELLQKLKADRIALPAIVITGHGSKALQERLLEAGALAMLEKPVDADELIAVIERALADTS
jgi:two-component system, LuxR family, response regulator FixJ